MAADYNPIDCRFYDELLAYATLRRPCKIIYRTEDGQELFAQGAIADIYTEGTAEYLRLQEGPTVRLDRLQFISPLPE